jgi:hypothetical protein
MQMISGILRIDPDHSRNGDTTIDFDNIPAHGTRIGNANMRQPILVNEAGGSVVNSGNKGRKFRGLPAYVVHIREWDQEDRTSFTSSGGEIDEYVLNSNVNSDRLSVSWNLGDNGRIVEIGFLCVGEPAN